MTDKSNKITRFADFFPQDTNLICVIWVDGFAETPNFPTIKFQNSTATVLNDDELIPMTISDKPQILNSRNYELKISTGELAKIKQWIVLNKQALLDYTNGTITTKRLYELVKPF